MTTQEIDHLITLWESDPTPPFRADPWILGWLPFGQEWAATSVLKNRPDFGWTFAYRMLGSRYSLPLLKRPAYRWIRAAMDLLVKYSASLDLPGDVAAVAWLAIQQDRQSSGSIMQYQNELKSGSHPRLLHDFLEENLPVPAVQFRKFRANRSMRDVEPSVELITKELQEPIHHQP